MIEPAQDRQALPQPRLYDVVILGAGPTGAIAAAGLARKGRDVLLLERARFPRYKVCGGCLNGRAITELSRMGLGELPARLGALPLEQLTLHCAKRSITLPLPGGMAISRNALDQALAYAARECGAQLVEGITAKPCKKTTGGWSVGVSNGDEHGTVHARALLIATGLGAKPLSDFGEPGRLSIWSGSRIGGGTLLTGNAATPIRSDPGVVDMCVSAGGYVGMARLEDNRIALAASLDANFIKENGGLAWAAASILRANGHDLPAGFHGARWRGTAQLTRQINPAGGRRFIIAGDAAGYVEPFTGEGLAWAISSGAKAADIIHAGIDDWPQVLSSQWLLWHRRNIGAAQARCRPIVKALRHNWAVSIGTASLALMPQLAAPLIRALNAPASS